MGQPIAGNPLQYMIEKAFVRAGLDWRYLTLEVAPSGLGDAIRGVKSMGFRGVHVTTPHRVAVVEYVDELTDAARLAGAVNCIGRQDDRLVGENTDGKGFVAALRELTDPDGKRIVVLGAGGVARAIVAELGQAETGQITIVNRTPDHAQRIVEHVDSQLPTPPNCVAWEDNCVVADSIDILINATPLGSGSGDVRFPVALDGLRPDALVADVTFNSPETRLLHEAKARGCKTLDGVSMFVNQVAWGFKYWTGQETDLAMMREALEEFLGL